MNKSLQTFFSTGEFAKLCNTTKDTLFHYDRVGILKPEVVRENGYRYYSANQFFDYDLIAVLKETGSSLHEIKRYLEHVDVEHFLAMLTEKQTALAEEKARIERMELALRQTIDMTRYAVSEPVFTPKIEACEEECLIAVELSSSLSDQDMVQRLRDHFLYCESIPGVDEFHLGSIVLKETLQSGECYDSYYYSKALAPCGGSRLMVKPKGLYAVMLHKGFYDTLPQSYEILKGFLREQGYSICGHGYEYDLIGYLAAGNQDNYIMQVSIQVEKAAEAGGTAQ